MVNDSFGFGQQLLISNLRREGATHEGKLCAAMFFFPHAWHAVVANVDFLIHGKTMVEGDGLSWMS